MGGGGKKGGQDSEAADAQARIAQQLFSQTDPLRSALINRSANFLGAGTPQPQMGGAPGGPLGEKMQAAGGAARGAAGPVGGGANPMDVRDTPTFMAYKAQADQGFNQAKDNIIARMPGGGGMTAALVGLEGDRASQLTQGAGAIYGDELSRAIALGTGITGQSLNSLGSAANTQAMIAQGNAQQNAGKAGALGTGVGAWLGGK